MSIVSTTIATLHVVHTQVTMACYSYACVALYVWCDATRVIIFAICACLVCDVLVTHLTYGMLHSIQSSLCVRLL